MISCQREAHVRMSNELRIAREALDNIRKRCDGTDEYKIREIRTLATDALLKIERKGG